MGTRRTSGIAFRWSAEFANGIIASRFPQTSRAGARVVFDERNRVHQHRLLQAREHRVAGTGCKHQVVVNAQFIGQHLRSA